MTFTATAFQLGTSTVVTLPKGLGITPGTMIDFTPSKSVIHLKPKKQKLSDEQIIRKLAGGFRGGKIDLTPQQMKELYDKDTYKI